MGSVVYTEMMGLSSGTMVTGSDVHPLESVREIQTVHTMTTRTGTKLLQHRSRTLPTLVPIREVAINLEPELVVVEAEAAEGGSLSDC